VLLKVSGEALCAPDGAGLDSEALSALAGELAAVRRTGVQIALVVGGGNFLRGATLSAAGQVGRAVADSMGMLATVMNALALTEVLRARDVPALAMSAVPMGDLCEPFNRTRAIDALDSGRLVVLGGGTGQPFFTTDTCAALRACQLAADALLKATKVDGVFEADPVTHPGARKFDRLTYAEVLARRLGVMDLAAVSLCMESRIPVIVFRLATKGNLAAAIQGRPVGTTIAVD
jgi:uridylate kinase